MEYRAFFKSQRPITMRIICVMMNRWLLLLLCILMQACATPVGKLIDVAEQNGFDQSKVRAGGFDLLVFSNQASRKTRVQDVDPNPKALHVYLEGDGSPWRYRVVVMPDPTPRNPLMLRLMGVDEQPSVYVGRPCYNGFADEPGCHSNLWTSARYSQPIIDSMACLLYTSPSPRDRQKSRMPSSA